MWTYFLCYNVITIKCTEQCLFPTSWIVPVWNNLRVDTFCKYVTNKYLPLSGQMVSLLSRNSVVSPNWNQEDKVNLNTAGNLWAMEPGEWVTRCGACSHCGLWGESGNLRLVGVSQKWLHITMNLVCKSFASGFMSWGKILWGWGFTFWVKPLNIFHWNWVGQ